MRFDLTDLRLILSIQEAGTITGGAEMSHMTLASASERIRGMEDALGVRLLLRHPRGVQPTPAGRTLAHHARLVLQQVDALQDALGAFRRGLRGHIRLLCNTSALSVHLPDVVSAFLADHPGVSIDLEERPSDDIADALRNDVGDIGIVADTADRSGLQSFDFCHDPLTLVVAHDHALAQRSTIGFADIIDGEFVGLTPGSALQEHVGQHARLLGKRLSYRVRLDSLESVCRVVGLGIGIGIVPRAAAVRYARSAAIRRVALTDAWAARRLVLCVRDVDELSATGQQLVRQMLSARPRRRL